MEKTFYQLVPDFFHQQYQMLFRMLGTSCTFAAWNNLAADASIPVIQPAAHYQSQSWKGTQETLWLCSFIVSKNSCFNEVFFGTIQRGHSVFLCAAIEIPNVFWAKFNCESSGFLDALHHFPCCNERLAWHNFFSNPQVRAINRWETLLLYYCGLHVCIFVSLATDQSAWKKLFTRPCWRKKCVECIRGLPDFYMPATAASLHISFPHPPCNRMQPENGRPDASCRAVRFASSFRSRCSEH